MTDAPFPPSGGARGAPVTTTYSGPSISTIPRRSSYASVLSGTALSPPSNSGPFSQLLTSNSTSYPPPFHPDGRHLRPSADVDADMQMNSSWRMSSGDTLPPYSRKYASFTRSDPFPPNPGSFSDAASSSFTPSYLRNSRYISRLDAARRAKLASQRDTVYSSSTSNPISTSSSQASLPRIAPSHRGMTYDIIEREPPGDDEHVMPLPSRWNDGDKYSGLELTSGGLEVRYTGPVNKHDHEAAAVRADNPMPPQCGIYYFEITILSKPKEGYVQIILEGGDCLPFFLPFLCPYFLSLLEDILTVTE